MAEATEHKGEIWQVWLRSSSQNAKKDSGNSFHRQQCQFLWHKFWSVAVVAGSHLHLQRGHFFLIQNLQTHKLMFQVIFDWTKHWEKILAETVDAEPDERNLIATIEDYFVIFTRNTRTVYQTNGSFSKSMHSRLISDALIACNG